METQINNSLILFGALALLTIAGLFKLLLEAIRSGKTYFVQAPSMGMGQRGGQGLNLSPLVIVAAIIVIVLAFNFDRIRMGNAASPNPTEPLVGTTAKVISNPVLSSTTPVPAASDEQNSALDTLNDFISWRENALRTREQNGIAKFLSDKAREQMEQSFAQLETENCFWDTQISPLEFVGARTTPSGTLQLSVSFNLQGRLYCNGQLDSRSLLNPVRVGATVDFIQANGRWLIQNSSALPQLTGTMAPLQQ